jgi:hypothetical protein
VRPCSDVLAQVQRASDLGGLQINTSVLHFVNKKFTFVLTASLVLVIIYLQWSVSRFGQNPGKVFGFNEFEFANLTVDFSHLASSFCPL